MSSRSSAAPESAEVIPLVRTDQPSLAEASRDELIQLYQHYRTMSNEWLRRQIVDNNRIDILAVSVLGYEIKPFHFAMLQWQLLHPDNLQLCFRGAGKSTTLTVTKTIHLLAKNRDLRILLCSKTQGNAEGFLKEIKGHFEENTRLAEIFGPFYDPARVPKWDNREIEVLGKKQRTKESSVTCVGVGGTIVSKHYDVMISDDLVDEDNSRSKYMRDQVRTWYYQTLDPCLEPPDSSVEHRGEHHRQGTRYHFDDLWGHLMANELKERTQVIPALDEDGRSPWPEKFSPEFLQEKRTKAGTIIFNAQYQCDTQAMLGEIFQYDDCQTIDDADIPKELRLYVGIDLAIKEDEKADLFAIVVIGVDKLKNYYVLEYFDGHLRFSKQTLHILRFWKTHDPLLMGIETNAYQLAQYQTLKEEDPDIRLIPLNTDRDKVARAWKLSAIFEDKRMFFRRGANLGRLIDALVMFPSYRYKDGFDALWLAYEASKKKRRKRRRKRKEPGVM